MYSRPNQAEFDLPAMPPAAPSLARARIDAETAISLLDVVWNVALEATPEQLSFLAWKISQVSNDVAHLDRMARATRTPNRLSNAA